MGEDDALDGLMRLRARLVDAQAEYVLAERAYFDARSTGPADQRAYDRALHGLLLAKRDLDEARVKLEMAGVWIARPRMFRDPITLPRFR